MQLVRLLSNVSALSSNVLSRSLNVSTARVAGVHRLIDEMGLTVIINYKLKSVAHLPMKSLIYKTLT